MENKHIILIIIVILAVAIFIFSKNTGTIFSIYPSNSGGASEPSCSMGLDPWIWKCGTTGTCTGIFYQKICCEYTPAVGAFEGAIQRAPEYLFCDNNSYTTFTPGSYYGTLKIYVASSQSTGIDYNKLKTITDNWKQNLHSASYGRIDNIEFILDPLLPDLTKPTISISRFGTEIKASYYFMEITDDTNSMQSFNHQFNSGINWNTIFSAAAFHAPYPYGWTTISTTPINYDGGCGETIQGGGFHDLCRESSHELAHALFGCEDYEGDTMRPLPDLNNYGYYPPICLKKIDAILPIVSQSSCIITDLNCDNIIDRAELGTAITNYIAGTLSRAELGEAIQSWSS